MNDHHDRFTLVNFLHEERGLPPKQRPVPTYLQIVPGGNCKEHLDPPPVLIALLSLMQRGESLCKRGVPVQGQPRSFVAGVASSPAFQTDRDTGIGNVTTRTRTSARSTERDAWPSEQTQ